MKMLKFFIFYPFFCSFFFIGLTDYFWPVPVDFLWKKYFKRKKGIIKSSYDRYVRAWFATYCMVLFGEFLVLFFEFFKNFFYIQI